MIFELFQTGVTSGEAQSYEKFVTIRTKDNVFFAYIVTKAEPSITK